MTTVADIRRVMNEWAPEALAEEWDNVGLLVGDPYQPVEAVLIALDVTDAVIEEAAEQGCQLILAHHPLPFRPLRRVRTDDPVGRKVAALLRHGISLYVAHTNFDVAPEGGGQVLAESLGLEKIEPFAPATRAGDVKVVVFTPPEAVEAVLDAMSAAGAGLIGNYSHCSFRSPGTGTYLPLEGAQPYAGEIGRLEQAEEYRLEMLVPGFRLEAVLQAMREAHPYEEVAYDVYPMENTVTPTGAGRVGYLPSPATLGDLLERIRQAWSLEQLRYMGDLQQRVERVAVLGGSGGAFISAAKAAGADVYITGDLKHHQALDAQDLDLALVDAGHAGTERVYLTAWVQRLRAAFPDLNVLLTQRHPDGFRLYEKGVK